MTGNGNGNGDGNDGSNSCSSLPGQAALKTALAAAVA